MEKLFLSGNEAVALAAMDAGLTLGVGYPGTPSSEILDRVAKLGGAAEWAPNEKCAMEVGAGVAFAGGNALVTMKHVGLNVAADPLFTLAYITIPGGLVVISADDPGMASSQNEQDNRRYAKAAGVMMLEPADSQQSYDLTLKAFELGREHNMIVLLRMTTRVCHSKSVVLRRGERKPAPATGYTRDPLTRVMIPGFARKAHRRLRAKLHELEPVANSMCEEFGNPEGGFGIITSGITAFHALEAAPMAAVLQVKMCHPAPVEAMRKFAARFEKCFVAEEGDPVLEEICAANGIKVVPRPEIYRFGELNVTRMRRLLAGDATPEPAPVPGKPPELCPGCPHRRSFEALRDLGCIVSGDIGCYTLGVLPPFSAIDSCVCMGASVTVALGLRHALPEDQARKVVSVIGDSTFWHTGINGVVEMVYNRPKTGHLLLILDNSITAMTGMQEHPGTGRKLDHGPAAGTLDLEKVLLGMGVDHVDVIDSTTNFEEYKVLVAERLASDDISVIIVRRPCIIGMVKSKAYSPVHQEENK